MKAFFTKPENSYFQTIIRELYEINNSQIQNEYSEILDRTSFKCMGSSKQSCNTAKISFVPDVYETRQAGNPDVS